MPALLMAFTACKSDDPKFGPSSYLFYVMQEGTEFSPYMILYTAYGELKSATITKGGLPLYGKVYPEYGIYLISPNHNSVPLLNSLSGTYIFDVVSAKDETAQASVTVDFSKYKELGEVEVSNFIYENEMLMAKFEPVENADYYAFYVEAYIDGKLTDDYFHNIFVDGGTSSTAPREVSTTFRAANLRYDQVRITPVASIQQAYGYPPVYRKAGESRILKKGGTAFEPVAE